ncbi:hypothetical protein F7734_45995 [Scytonema sp. UIC 10036]|uniref:hypothetical protein n=1 Tax=Scytonema sp. UIC 10036 TaxID=2304196 RepID=UPI0012DAAD9C|nr:hypothetical protein [Scytonema sp. UIC 10036]MUG99258.1 hypothetical protein [Scytonema sp. UIC 10036]
MSDRKQPVERQEKADFPRAKQRIAYRAATGIGGGIVGAAIGGLLGRRVGGSVGGVVGAVAGALVGKGTAQRVNATVEGVVGAAKTVADAVHYSVNGVGDALKDTVEQVKPSIVGAVDAVKDTVEQVKPSVVGVVDTVKDTVEQVKPSVVDAARNVAEVVNFSANTEEVVFPEEVVFNNDIIEQPDSCVVVVEENAKGQPEEVTLPVVNESQVEQVNTSVVSQVDTVKDIPEDVWDSVANTPDAVGETIEQIEPRAVGIDGVQTTTEDSHSHDAQEWMSPHLNNLQQANNSEENIESINFEETQEQHQPQEPQQTQAQSEKNRQFAEIGKFVVGAGVIALVGTILSWIPKHNLFAIKSPESGQVQSSQSIEQVSAATSSSKLKAVPVPDGWIFLGNVNGNPGTASVGKPLSEDLQSTDSRVVPSAGAIVTVTVKPGVTLRGNRPHLPHFSYQEQKALAVLKPKEKLKVLKVEFVPNPSTTQTTRVWAKVSQCGKDCH